MKLARQLLPLMLLLSLSGCGNVFDMVAGIFGGDDPQEEVPGAPAAGETEYAAGLYCFREYRYLKLDGATCRRLGGIMVEHDGKPPSDAPPAPQPRMEVQAASLDELPVSVPPTTTPLRENDIFMRNPAVRYSGAAADRPVSAAAPAARPGEPNGTDPWAPTVTSKLDPAGGGRADDAGAASARCYREYRYIDFSEEACRRVGGTYVPDGRPLPPAGTGPIKSSAAASTPSADDPIAASSEDGGFIPVVARSAPRRIVPGRQQESRADIAAIVDMPTAAEWEAAKGDTAPSGGNRSPLVIDARATDAPIWPGTSSPGSVDDSRRDARRSPGFLKNWQCVDTSGGILDVPLPECDSVGGTPRKGRLPRALVSERPTRDDAGPVSARRVTRGQPILAAPAPERSVSAPLAQDRNMKVGEDTRAGGVEEITGSGGATSGIGCLYQNKIRDWLASTCRRLGGNIVPVHASLARAAAPAVAPTQLARGAAPATRNPDIFMSPEQVAALRRSSPTRPRGSADPQTRPSFAARPESQDVPRSVAWRPATGKSVPSAMVAELRRAFPSGRQPAASPIVGGDQTANRLPTGNRAALSWGGTPQDAPNVMQGQSVAGHDAASQLARGESVRGEPVRGGSLGGPRATSQPDEACVWDPHLLALSQGACRALGGNPGRAPFDTNLSLLPPTGRDLPPRPDPATELLGKSPRWRQLGMVY